MSVFTEIGTDKLSDYNSSNELESHTPEPEVFSDEVLCFQIKTSVLV